MEEQHSPVCLSQGGKYNPELHSVVLLVCYRLISHRNKCREFTKDLHQKHKLIFLRQKVVEVAIAYRSSCNGLSTTVSAGYCCHSGQAPGKSGTLLLRSHKCF